MIAQMHNPVAQFLRSLEGRSRTDRRDAFVMAAIESGGTFAEDLDCRLNGEPTFAIRLFDIAVRRATEREAIERWIDRAHAAIERAA